MASLTKSKLQAELRKTQEILSIIFFTPSMKELKKSQSQAASKAKSDFKEAKKKGPIFKSYSQETPQSSRSN